MDDIAPSPETNDGIFGLFFLLTVVFCVVFCIFW